jgi:hypothetical protein
VPASIGLTTCIMNVVNITIQLLLKSSPESKSN